MAGLSGNILEQTNVGGTDYNFRDLDRGCEFIYGTQTATTGSWTGVTTDTELVDGKQILYFLPFAGSGNATLNLTLADGTTTGAKNVYFQSTTRMTTHYGQYTQFRLIYHANHKIGNTYYEGWWSEPGRDTTTTNATQIQLNSNALKAGSSALTKYNIIVADSNGLYKHLKAGTAFDITYPIVYLAENVAANKTTSNVYTETNFAVATTQSITLTAQKPVFIKGTLSGTTFTPVSTTPLTQTIPSSADGYHYIYLGYGYATTAIRLQPYHPIFAYINGAFNLYTGVSSYANSAGNAATVNNHTVAKNVPSDAKFTDSNVKQEEVSTSPTNDPNYEVLLAGWPDSSGVTTPQQVLRNSEFTYDLNSHMGSIPKIKANNTIYGILSGNYSNSVLEVIIKTGIIPQSNSKYPAIINIKGAVKCLSEKTEQIDLKILVYKGSQSLNIRSRVINEGVITPEVYIFKYSESYDFTAIGLKFSESYTNFNFSIDVYSYNISTLANLENDKWTWEHYNTGGNIPEPDDGVTCYKAIYTADILNSSKVNGHTVNADVPSDAVFTDHTYSGTGLISVSDAGVISTTATANTGTVTGVKINGTTKSPSSGIVDIGTVATSNTTYSFANGTGGFSVTPSGGSTQTVTVTPVLETYNINDNDAIVFGHQGILGYDAHQGNANYQFPRPFCYNSSKGNLQVSCVSGMRVGTVSKVQTGQSLTFVVPKSIANDFSFGGIVFGRLDIISFIASFKGDGSALQASKLVPICCYSGSPAFSCSLGSDSTVGEAWFVVITMPSAYNRFSFILNTYNNANRLRQVRAGVIINGVAYYEDANRDD